MPGPAAPPTEQRIGALDRSVAERKEGKLRPADFDNSPKTIAAREKALLLRKLLAEGKDPEDIWREAYGKNTPEAKQGAGEAQGEQGGA